MTAANVGWAKRSAAHRAAWGNPESLCSNYKNQKTILIRAN
jgi:hypothetical protein